MRAVRDTDRLSYAAIDPGGVSGVAIYTPELGFQSCEVPGGALGFAHFWRSVLDQGTVGYVVAEKFVITPATATKTRQYDALEIIGWLRLECDHLGIPFKTQTASEGKSFGTDSKLKHLGWFDRTPNGHRNDAARHLVKYLADAREPWVLKQLEELA